MTSAAGLPVERTLESRLARLPGPLVMTAIVLLASNLRPAVNALGAVMPELRAETAMSGGLAGFLLALPTLAFAVLGVGAPALARRIGSHSSVLVAVLALIAGQLLRIIPGTGWLFAGSVVALAGIAVGNVLLPGLVRLHYPRDVSKVTAIYTVMLTAGSALGSALSLPLAHAAGGGWQLGLGMWAALAVPALVPWLVMAVRMSGAGRTASRHGTLGPWSLRRSRLAWAMAGYFGLQSLQAYVIFGWLPQILVDEGMSSEAGGFQVFIVAAVGIPIAAVVPALTKRFPRPWALVVGMNVIYLIGYLGLMLSPVSPAWLWSVLLGIGGGAFPLALTLIALRARTPDGVVALSAFTQSAGYLMATTGPLLFGLGHDATGGWTWPLIGLCVIAVVHLLCGLAAARPRYLEDTLVAPAGTGAAADRAG